MIKFYNHSNHKPFLEFRSRYQLALRNNQKMIQAACVSSVDQRNHVDSRFVNIKFLDGSKFIFFTNYDSPKSKQFNYSDQIAVSIYWDSIHTQIRIKARIKKTPIDFNKKYFINRSPEKNALAISSNQSNYISSYDEVLNKYQKVKNEHDLFLCPDYWGGYEFEPYKIEFWKGEKNRLNKRVLYYLKDDAWSQNILEP